MTRIVATLTTVTNRAGSPRVGVHLHGLHAGDNHLDRAETIALAERLTELASVLTDMGSEVEEP
ncbi:MAG: hypothetical protein ACTIJJ_05670 [Galactobacter sp.]